MPTLTGGQALVQALKREGVEVVFGLPGVQLDWAFDALYEERDSIRVVHTRHEQGTSYMADGYARSTGKVGVCLVVPGPGLLNAGAGLSTAYATNSRVLCISGQVPTHHIGKERGALHEIKNQLEAIGAVTKWAGRAMNTSDVPGLVREAFYQLNSGRPRPVEIEVPMDVLMTPADVEFYEPGMPSTKQGDPDQLEKAAHALGNSERPLIFVGGGIITSEASAELQELAEMLGAPVIVSQNGRGALSDRHPLALPSIAAYDLLPNADVILAVGTRFVMPGPNPYPTDEGQTVIHIDIDDTELSRNSKPDIGIVADAKGSLADLVRRVPRHKKTRESRDDEIAAARATVQEKLAAMSPVSEYAGAIRKALPEDGIFVTEVTQVGYFSNQGFPVYSPRSYIGAGYQGTLGYGFNTALGVKVGNPDRPVVAISGDGGFMYGAQELSTAVRYGINLVTVVFNDGAFGNVRRIQDTQFDHRLIASDLHNPDFVKYAEAFGAQGRRAETPEELTTQVEEALKAEAPALIEVPLGVMPNPFAMFAPPPEMMERALELAKQS